MVEITQLSGRLKLKLHYYLFMDLLYNKSITSRKSNKWSLSFKRADDVMEM